MTDKKQPKIRVVSLSGKSPTENSGSRAADCKCEDDTCPECRVQCIECGCEGGPEACPCESDPSGEKKQQQSTKEELKPRTFFKIAEKNK
jgi:hypothetical protein